ncbi:peptidyl-alpha-hydroxyglycine alpha-amidating lyase 2-like [Planococcus citri]|uniref:peptidyl-alpha-hydroxyglycine alpha-amidating lyase 2-like n=1 Tax=Planococcus citri TaxID=170843 RepID=UPI0031F85526
MSSYTIYILIILSLVLTGNNASYTKDNFYKNMHKILADHGLTEDDDVIGNRAEQPILIPPPRPKEVENWPQAKLPHLGEISGVTINRVGQPVIFHRGSRNFNEWSFNETNDFQFINEGPIDIDTILTLDPKSGKVLSGWGRGFFYLPHGITIDHEGNTWLTDIAMHQVFKFSPGSSRPSMTFGQKFKHGSGVSKLCMPTSVAVAHTGDIFIADGYCNSRVLKFNYRGDLVRLFPQQWEFLSLQVPHSLTLMEQFDLLCIADRENMRVICVKAELGNYNNDVQQTSLNIQQPDLGRVFAITAHEDYIYAINGPTSPMIAIQGFTLNPLAESIVDHWDSFAQKMLMPHDIAITEDGRELYIVSVTPSRILKFTMDWPQRKIF